MGSSPSGFFPTDMSGGQIYLGGEAKMVRHHHRAILVTVLLNQVVGLVWYSPYLFLNPWTAGLGKKVSELDKGNLAPFVGAIFGAFLSCYVISWLLQRLGANTGSKGASVGIILWVGIALPVLLPHYMFAGLSFSVLFIDALNVLFILVMTGFILATWRKSRLY
jgi:hypothetical protein